MSNVLLMYSTKFSPSLKTRERRERISFLSVVFPDLLHQCSAFLSLLILHIVYEWIFYFIFFWRKRVLYIKFNLIWIDLIWSSPAPFNPTCDVFLTGWARRTRATGHSGSCWTTRGKSKYLLLITITISFIGQVCGCQTGNLTLVYRRSLYFA